MSETINCNCKPGEADVCSNCLDIALEELAQDIINGTAGRNFIDLQIELKTYLISIISEPKFVKKAQSEILALKQFREMQHND
jgi:hypothetical protein